MSRVRDIANLFSSSTDAATDAEVTAAIASHSAAADPHTGYLKESEFNAAGKNKIINGDFGVWQRGTSISLTSGNGFYFADRFYGSCNFSAGTASFSQQTFTPGTAPVAGYEGQYFARLTCGSTSTHFSTYQKIEDVRTLAGTTATYSFWAKASTNVTVALYGVQGFGSGGSANVDVTISPSTASLTTSWQRFTATVTVPSVSGKTIGTGSTLTIGYYYSSGTINSATIDLWGVQLEAGSVATSFQTATGNPQGELAACQRYYWRQTAFSIPGGTQSGYDNNVWFPLNSFNAVPMRTAPTAAIESTPYIADFNANLRNITSVNAIQKYNIGFAYDSTKLTTAYSYGVNFNDAGRALSFSAEYSL